jgi:hypothetical protein
MSLPQHKRGLDGGDTDSDDFNVSRHFVMSLDIKGNQGGSLAHQEDLGANGGLQTPSVDSVSQHQDSMISANGHYANSFEHVSGTRAQSSALVSEEPLPSSRQPSVSVDRQNHMSSQNGSVKIEDYSGPDRSSTRNLERLDINQTTADAD